MKDCNFFQNLKQWSLKVSVSGIIFVSVMLLGGAIITLAAPSSLNDVKSTNSSNTLTAENWNYVVDQVMGQIDKLATLSGKLATLDGSIQNWFVNNQGGGVPAGAVMAFDLSTCPAGRTRFTDADNRFIMGASNNFREKGGNVSVMLAANQMAPHSHWFVDSFFAESATYDDHGITPRLGFRAGVDLVSGNGWYGTKANKDYDNYLQVVWRRTGSKLVAGSGDVHSNTPGNVTAGARAYDWQSGMPDNGSVVQQAVNIQNPYIKLIYCKKS